MCDWLVSKPLVLISDMHAAVVHAVQAAGAVIRAKLRGRRAKACAGLRSILLFRS